MLQPRWFGLAGLNVPARVLVFSLLVASPVVADTIDMPIGGTSWINLSANGCNNGIPGDISDCAGATTNLPLAEYFPSAGGSIQAQGSVTPYQISLSETDSGYTGGSAFLAGFTGGTFTLHGAGASFETVTAAMSISGSLDRTNSLTSTTANWRIGSWNYGAVASELNFRVVPIVSDGTNCFFNACAPGSVTFSDTLTHSVSVLTGSTFNMGFQAGVTAFGLSAGSLASASIIADISFIMPEGYYITGDNGYDSRGSAPVPEPTLFSLLLVGLAGLGSSHRMRTRTY